VDLPISFFFHIFSPVGGNRFDFIFGINAEWFKRDISRIKSNISFLFGSKFTIKGWKLFLRIDFEHERRVSNFKEFLFHWIFGIFKHHYFWK